MYFYATMFASGIVIVSTGVGLISLHGRMIPRDEAHLELVQKKEQTIF
jgi:hypothetical protein